MPRDAMRNNLTRVVAHRQANERLARLVEEMNRVCRRLVTTPNTPSTAGNLPTSLGARPHCPPPLRESFRMRGLTASISVDGMQPASPSSAAYLLGRSRTQHDLQIQTEDLPLVLRGKNPKSALAQDVVTFVSMVQMRPASEPHVLDHRGSTPNFSTRACVTSAWNLLASALVSVRSKLR